MPSMRPYSSSLRRGAGRPFPDGHTAQKERAALSAAYESVLARLGVTQAQYLVLAALWERDGSTPAHLAHWLRVEVPTVERWLVDMVGADLVEVDADAVPSDIWLSPRGRTLKEVAPDVSSTVLVQTVRWSRPDSVAPDGM